MVLDPNPLDLEGRVALVTGAASGIGAAVASALSRFGARLALCDRDAVALDETEARLAGEGVDVLATRLDVRDDPAVDAFVGQVVARFGRIDILVNNAGGTFQADFEATSPGGQQALVDLNFNAVAKFIRSVVPHMDPGEGDAGHAPSIVNITSVEAHRAAPGYAVYAAMKAAVENLGKSLALELGARGIRINSVAPDMIPTPGTGEMNAETPLARRGHVDDVAGAVLYLASPLAGFVTGSTLHVDGGTHAAGGWRRDAAGRFTLD